jgi:regulator of sigma E protease
VIKRVDGKVETVFVTPQQSGLGGMRLLQIGIRTPERLEGPELTSKRLAEDYADIPAARRRVQPGDRIVAIQGQPVGVDDYYKLDAAAQAAAGKPVAVTVQDKEGKKREENIETVLAPVFGGGRLVLAGMEPRATIEGLTKPSAVEGKIQPGDVVTEIAVNGDVRRDPTPDELSRRTLKAGADGQTIRLKVLRDGKELAFDGLKADVRLSTGLGLGMASDYELAPAVVGGTDKDSPANMIPIGSRIVSIAGTTISSWTDVLREIRSHKPGDVLEIVADTPGVGQQKFTLAMRNEDVQFANDLRFVADATLNPWMKLRKTSNPLQAAWWGVTETRDSVLQVYITLQRLFQRSVPFKGLMGPVGLAQTGTKVAAEGWDKLLWFLAIISANLAVVNFLPIPVVDGGHFLFLTIEKLQRKPVSPRTMEIAQYVGLAVILTVFVLVTYQDIMRFFIAH